MSDQRNKTTQGDTERPVVLLPCPFCGEQPKFDAAVELVSCCCLVTRWMPLDDWNRRVVCSPAVQPYEGPTLDELAQMPEVQPGAVQGGEREAWRDLLSAARCPDCDGSGAIAFPVADIGCCGNFCDSGECCGNGIPIQGQPKIEQCQWCAERDAALARSAPPAAAEAELWRDALDHIMRVACAARQPTARTDWIAARAKRALAGKPYDQEELPRYPKMAPAGQRREPQDFTERAPPAVAAMPIPKSRHEAWVMHTALLALYPDLAGPAVAAAQTQQEPKPVAEVICSSHCAPTIVSLLGEPIRPGTKLYAAPLPATESSKEKP